MAAKKKKRSPAIARSELLLMGMDKVIQLRESYSTIRRRLQTSELFVEVTDKLGRKVLFNKTVVSSLMPAE